MDYLTDANSDGVYELLDGQDDPICDVVTADGRLTAWDGVDHRLSLIHIWKEAKSASAA